MVIDGLGATVAGVPRHCGGGGVTFWRGCHCGGGVAVAGVDPVTTPFAMDLFSPEKSLLFDLADAALDSALTTP